MCCGKKNTSVRKEGRRKGRGSVLVNGLFVDFFFVFLGLYPVLSRYLFTVSLLPTFSVILVCQGSASIWASFLSLISDWRGVVSVFRFRFAYLVAVLCMIPCCLCARAFPVSCLICFLSSSCYASCFLCLLLDGLDPLLSFSVSLPHPISPLFAHSFLFLSLSLLFFSFSHSLSISMDLSFSLFFSAVSCMFSPFCSWVWFMLPFLLSFSLDGITSFTNISATSFISASVVTLITLLAPFIVAFLCRCSCSCHHPSSSSFFCSSFLSQTALLRSPKFMRLPSFQLPLSPSSLCSLRSSWLC